MIEHIKQLDTDLFLWLNSFHNSFFDVFFYWITDRFFWVPFYLYLFFLVCKEYKTNVWKILIVVILLIIASDQLSVFIKDNVQRYRPCHNLELQKSIHLVNGECGGQFGFVSSHAANSMALGLFLILSFVKRIKWLTAFLVLFVVLVSYSRIYLGKHYPMDIIGGWVIGITISYAIHKIFLKAIPYTIKRKL